MRNTKSQMGSLTEAARNHPNSVRTGHPIYSFCAIGKHASKFKMLDNVSGYGADSPFGILRNLRWQDRSSRYRRKWKYDLLSPR